MVMGIEGATRMTPADAGNVLIYRVTNVLDDSSNVVIRETWENNDGQLSRLCGPAFVERTDDGKVLWEEWWFEGMRHRGDGGPAVIDYDEEGGGRVCRMEWWKDGQRHRTDGPARVWYDPATGASAGAEWWIGGFRFDPGRLQHPDWDVG